MRKPSAKKVLHDATRRALVAVDAGEPTDLPVWVPPAIRGKRPAIIKELQVSRDQVLDIKANLVRIQTEADPIGMIMAVAMGIPVPVYRVQADGSVICEPQTLSLKDRMMYAKWLGDRVIPKMSVNFKIKDESGDSAGFSSIVEAAANRVDDE